MNLTIRNYLLLLLVLLLGLSACNGEEEATPTPDNDRAAAREEEEEEEAEEAADEPAEEDEEPAEEAADEEATAVPASEPTAEPAPPAESGSASFESADCEFTEPIGYDVSCGYLTVPEDRTQANGPSIRLHVAIFPSESDNPAPDPVVYLEGGPGGEPLETLIFIFDDYFAPLLAERDLIIFDQRGTGFSEPSLACPEMTEATFEYLDDLLTNEEETAIYLEVITACRDRLLEDGVNLAAFNSRENAADLNDLRQALGYEEWNLYGISYGTKLAMTTMRDHPQGIRSVILDSAYPPPTSLITDVPRNIDRAFDTFFAGCAADAACAAAYPDLETSFFDTVAALDETPPLIEVTDFFNAERYDAVITGDILIATLFQSLYSAEIIPVLPKMITDTAAGDYQLLGLLVSNNISNQQFISQGMNTSVQCHEEVVFDTPEDAEAAIAAYPHLADFFGDPTLDFQVCDLWAAGAADPIENEPVSSAIPTLVMAGEYDPITPPAFGRLAAETLSNSYYFEYPGLGHGVSVSGECPQGMMLSFLNNPTAEPDSSCIAAMGAPPFEVPLAAGEEAPVELEPFSTNLGLVDVGGVVPAGWEDMGVGTYMRGQNGLDQTTLLIQVAPGNSAELFTELLASQLGLEDGLADNGTYTDANDRAWSLQGGNLQGLPVDIGVSEADGVTYVVLLLSNPGERDGLLDAVLFPVMDAVMVEE